MSMLSNLDLVRRVPLFAEITLEQAAVLSDSVVKCRYKRGEVIVEQGTQSNSLFIILAGRARVVMKDRKSREVILTHLKPGDYIGEMSLIDNGPHSASVEAEVQTDVLVLGRAEFTNCLAESSAMAQFLMTGLVRRLRKSTDKIGSLALLGVYGRVADVLLDTAVEDEQHQMLIRDKISRQDLAKMVGASREMVSRVMRDFEDQGFIETLKGGGIVVKDRRSVKR